MERERQRERGGERQTEIAIERKSKVKRRREEQADLQRQTPMRPKSEKRAEKIIDTQLGILILCVGKSFSKTSSA